MLAAVVGGAPKRFRRTPTPTPAWSPLQPEDRRFFLHGPLSTKVLCLSAPSWESKYALRRRGPVEADDLQVTSRRAVDVWERFLRLAAASSQGF